MAGKPKHRLYGSSGNLNQGSDYSEAEIEWMLAMERYKRENQRPYPTPSEILAVAKSLGYRRILVKES